MGNIKLLVLEEKKRSKDKRLGTRMERTRALNAISASGSRVRHDSGGRLIVIETSSKAEALLLKLLPDAKVVAVGAEMKSALPKMDMDPTESLFVEALQIRNTKRYRDAKKARKVGESPEEKELLSAPCVREEY